MIVEYNKTNAGLNAIGTAAKFASDSPKTRMNNSTHQTVKTE